MPYNIQGNEYKTNKLRNVFFGFNKVIYKKIYVIIAKKRAHMRVHKMLKNNFVKIENEKKNIVKKEAIKIVNTSYALPKIRISKTWRGVAAVFSVSFLILIIITSQYYGPQYIEAEILVQNFTESENHVTSGIELLKYDTRTVNDIDSKAQFDTGDYTNGNFETGEDDLVAVADIDDYLTIGSYGDNVPDTSQNDWWAGEQIQTCSSTSFQQGTFTDTQWDNGNDWAELDSTGLTNQIGYYESEVLDAGSNIVWNDMMWTSNRPTYKELPDNLGTESVYGAGNVNMTNNLLLMHLNESNGTINNTSGVTNNGTYNGALYGQSGRFNTSIGFDGVDDYIDLGQDLSQIIGGTGSVAFWLKTTQTGSNTPWVAPGITGSEQGGTGNDVFWGYITANGNIAVEAGNITGAISTTAINDNVWHHVALTRDAVSGRVEVYVDGTLEASAISETGVKTQFFDGIGRIYDDSGAHDYYQGDLDEVSFWSNIMTSTEIYDQYRRGANRLKFQVRSCDDSACIGESYIGPDSTSATYYTEETNNTVGLPTVTLAGVSNNQYIQYRVNFETDNSAISPELLCVTFNNGSNRKWTYRKCFDVDHTASGAVDETQYQVYLDMDTATLVSANKMEADGADMRFVDENGNLLPYFIADDMNTASTRVWLQMDNIDAGDTEEVCMYYGNSSATGFSSRQDVFTYSTQKEIYHVVANTAESTISEFASYSDNNNVSIGTYNNTLNQYDNAQYPNGTGPTLAQTTAISTTDPVNGGYNVDGTDNLIPASFASENFIYRMDRYTNYFSFVSPWCSANVEVRNASGTIVTNGSFTIAQGAFHNLTTDNTAGGGIPNNDTVMIEVTNGCPILAQHHGSTGGDSFVMAPASTEWYGVGSGHFGFAALYDNTNVTVYKSDNTSTAYTLNRGDNIDINDTGSQGSDPAHRVVADNLIGVSALADGDGGEAVTFLPVEEMGYKYYVPENTQYIAVATKEGITTTVDLYHDGTNCGVGVPDDTTTVVAGATYPGKVYFGSTTNGTNIPAGSCIVADNTVYAYYEYSGTEDEHNIWSEKQNKQFISPAPTYTVTAEEIGSWSVDGTNTWSRRTPITINNTSTTALSEYQINIDLGSDVSGIFTHVQADGGDIRVAGNAGDGTDNIVYAVEDFDSINTEGKLWVQIPFVGASSNTTIYIYYNPITVSETCNQSEFNNGTYIDTQWNTTSSWAELDATGLTNGTGQYTSEIFNATANVAWDNISWTSNRPTFKEIPDNTGIETVYGAGNFDMSNNVLLLHMNESSGTIVDSSGEGNDGTYNGTGYSASGRFNTGLDFDGNNDEIVISDDASLDFATEVTAATWIYLDSTSGWQSFFHKNTDTSNHLEVYFEQNNGILYNYNTINTGTAVLTAGQWHHIAYTADATRERLYVDGQIVADEALEYGGTSNNNNLYIGGSGGGGEQVDGRMDEASMWTRALSSTEITDLYRRGANRLKFQVRSCDDSACVGETFIGPDGTTSTYYTEETNNTINLPTSTLTNLINNQYFQYHTIFETDENTTTPELSCVSITRGLAGMTTTGDYDAIFHTSTQKANYYVVDERAVGETLSVISFADGNSVNDTFTTQIIDEGAIVTIPEGSGIIQTDAFSVTGPLHIGFNGDVTDSALPISYSGREFVYRVDRGNDVFSFYAPFSDATVQIQESGASGWTTLQTVSVSTGTVQTVAQDIINTRAFKIISDVPILGFHAASNNDSKILYPTHLALEEDSGSYEIYGVASASLLLASASDANIILYRSDGTTANITLNATNNFSYTESGSGSQGTARAYHIVSDAPIGATSYADADGIETTSFISQKEFSREYVVANPTQYMAIVARDANVTCRVYDNTGTEVTTDSTGTMNNIPPQTGGTQVDPYPNNIHIGGADTSDGAYFTAGYRMNCDEPVYAYYEHHLNSSITDETNWLTWPQVRQRSEVEPNVEDVDGVDEQGLFYESGKDSSTTGNDFEAYAEYTFDTSTLIYGEHTYWRDITWEEIINSRSSTNGVEQITVEVASADPIPNCANATYGSYTAITPTTLATSVDSSLPYVTYTTNIQQILLPDNFSDHSCMKMRTYLRTGDQVYAPRINNIKTAYYLPTILDDQISSPIISVVGATNGSAKRYRIIKAITNDTGLNGSQVFTTYEDTSNSGVFIQADLDLFEIPTQTTNGQFTFPPFPVTTPVDAATASPFDSTNDTAVYFTNERTNGAIETMDFIFNVDIISAGGPQISRDFQLEISGL
jgi:hypothetical protein